METVGNRIKILREKKGFTQEELASHLFVTRQTVSSWERDNSLPNVEQLNNLALLFGVSLNKLAGDKNLRNRKLKYVLIILIGVLLPAIFALLSNQGSLGKQLDSFGGVCEVGPEYVTIRGGDYWEGSIKEHRTIKLSDKEYCIPIRFVFNYSKYGENDSGIFISADDVIPPIFMHERVSTANIRYSDFDEKWYFEYEIEIGVYDEDVFVSDHIKMKRVIDPDWIEGLIS